MYCLVALGRGSDTQVDYIEDNRYFVAPSFTWKPSDVTTFTFLSHYQKDETGNAMQFMPYQGSVLANPNGEIPTNRLLGESGFDGYDREQFAVGYALKHHFNKSLTVRQNLRYADVKSELKGVFPFNSGGFLDANSRLIDRDVNLYRDQTETFTLDNQLQVDFVTGEVRHTFLSGVDFRHFIGDRQMGGVWSGAGSLDVFAPVYGQPFDDVIGGSGTFSTPNMGQRFSQELDQVGFYGQDQLKWNRWITTTIGVRYD